MSKKTLLIFFLLFTSPVFAQVKDAGLWLSLNAEYKFNKKVSAAFSQEFRFNENISELGTAFSEISVDYKLRFIKGLSVSPGYRFIQRRNLDDSYSLRHRFLFDVMYRRTPGKFSITLRERFQSQVADVKSSEEGFAPVSYLRNKLTVKYDLKDTIQPWLAAELFYQLNNASGNEFDNIRYSAGADVDLSKKHSFSIFYLVNKEINVNDPWTDYVIGAGYKYSF
jgi:hypothetical protein